MNSADNDLMIRVKSGDRRAFDLLCGRFRSHVQRTCRRYLWNAEEVEDATQEAFLRVWNYRETFKEGASFVSWLDHIARMAAIARFNRKQGKPVEAELSPDIPSNDKPHEERVLDLLLARRVLEELSRRVDSTGMIMFRLHYMEQRSAADIARIMGEKVDMVKGRLHRMKNKFAEIRREYSD